MDKEAKMDEGSAVSDTKATQALSIPETTEAGLRSVQAQRTQVFEALGRLEADYLASKSRLLRELEAQDVKQKQILDGAARALGLDIDNQRWNFDFGTMTFSAPN